MTDIDEFFRKYLDPGMQKWQGFFLSDHTSRLQKDAKLKFPDPEDEMSEQEVGQRLFEAFAKHQAVRIQLLEVDQNGHYSEDLLGFVEGFYDDQVIISGQAITQSNIRHVSTCA
ncbi:MAG: hypothetical protein Q3960_03990 [Lactobacillus sp.]|nr:hypothetical protein [Lactobacillus sp.]